MNRKRKTKEPMKLTENTKEKEIMNRETLKTKAQNMLNKHGIKRLGKDWRTKLIRVSGASGILILLGLGIFGQMGWLPNTNPETGERTGWFGKEIARNSESSNWNPFAEPKPQTNLQLSKEYIYAGSRLLAIEEAGGGNPTPTPFSYNCPDNFSDDFDDGVMNTAFWDYTWGNSAGVYERNGVLESGLDPATGQYPYVGYMSKCGLPINGTTISVKFIIPADPSGVLGILSNAGTVTFVNGNLIMAGSSFPVQGEIWVRIRNDIPTSTVYYETSSDGLTWTVKTTTPAPTWGNDGTFSVLLWGKKFTYDNFSYTNSNN